MANFPNSVPSFTTKAAAQTIQPAHVNDLQDEVVAVGTQLLTPVAWTPIITASTSASGQTYTTQAGSYIRSGKLILAYGRITLSAVGTLTGTVRIGGFPVACNATANLHPTIVFGYCGALTATVVSVQGFMTAGTTAGDLYIRTAAAATPTGMVQGDLSATSDFIFSVMYHI